MQLNIVTKFYLAIANSTCSTSVSFATILYIAINRVDFLLLLLHTNIRTHAVGTSLELLSVDLPNNSFVEVNDLIDIPLGGLNPLPDRNLPTLHCFTDLVDCCNEPRSLGGEWYFPNGTALDFDFLNEITTFRRNRGPNGLHGPGGAMVYGVIRLFRRGIPPERGRFCCEAPTAAGVNQTLCANICELNYDQT